jgi:chondroitin 4-sulfotransferase 11
MIISDSTKTLFVHIQKTGGQTIRKVLMDHLPGACEFMGTHDHAAWARENLGPAFDSYYKFAFVRNPWDRLVSWYSMIEQKTAHCRRNGGSQPAQTGNRLWAHVLDNAANFDEFIRRCTGTIEDSNGKRSFCFNQLDYVSDASGKIIVDEIFRYESFHDGCRKLFERLGIKAEIPHENRSAHSHYAEFYTAETREIVRLRFARDIEQFGYQFGS